VSGPVEYEKIASVLVFVGHTMSTSTRSGVQRVVLQIAKHLPRHVKVDFVKWDAEESQLRYIDELDIQALFGKGDIPEFVTVHPCAHKMWYRFGDTLADGGTSFLLYPEVPFLTPDGSEIFGRIVSQCREYNVTVASLLYDIIPITNPDYREAKDAVLSYVEHLSRSDLVLSISKYSADVLIKYYRDLLGDDCTELASLERRIHSLPIAGNGKLSAADIPIEASERDRILLLGTVEPRKQQVEVLRSFNALCKNKAIDLDLYVVGSLHPKVAAEFRKLKNANPRVHYLGFVSDEDIDQLWQRSRFAVFASRDEGYGLPIVEALERNVPCIAANFGAMAEIGKDGGCLHVDVNDRAALTDAIYHLATDDDAVEALRMEIENTSFRTWDDYCLEIVGQFQGMLSTQAKEATAWKKWFDWGSKPSSKKSGSLSHSVGVYRVTGGGQCEFSPFPSFMDCDRSLIVIDGENVTNVDIVKFVDENPEVTFSAVGWFALDKKHLEVLNQCAEQSNWSGLVPEHQVCSPTREILVQRQFEVAYGTYLRCKRRQSIAASEKLFGLLAKKQASSRSRIEQPLLSIVISTFNRGKFVAENVRWLLSVIDSKKADVELIVVDNTSTDDTQTLLAPHIGHPKLKIIRNNANVGMLGNLRVCSTLMRSQFTWVTGDDDYIVAENFEKILDVLQDNPRLPFLFVNFGVYHRFELSPGDGAENLIAERNVLAPNPTPSGKMPVKRVAEEHDNMFTAIYPIIFRSDLLSACFNYPFDGEPFSDLVECIPTTKIFLESYSDCESYWFSEPGIVGNAHNSWSRHRPRWHAVIMPITFELAREAGVDESILKPWLQVHYGLFEEAVGVATEAGVGLNIRNEEYQYGQRQFVEPFKVLEASQTDSIA
tara:strand:- start:3573 stop:6230 length:2658 start_codon:yes stop_codon:yes gene_type:complete